MSHYLNLFYIIVLGLSTFGVYQIIQSEATVLSFYGFAETNETEVNYNYAVVVDEILVTPGQNVNAGQTLLKLSRLKSKESLVDQPFQIAELQSEARLWSQRKRDQIAEEKLVSSQAVSEIDKKIFDLQEELSYKKSLADELQTISASPSTSNPIVQRITSLEKELAALREAGVQKIASLENELRIGKNPYLLQ